MSSDSESRRQRFPAPEYAETVLERNFEDAKRLFLRPLLDINYAHTVMLAGCGIVSADDARAILAALDNLDPDAISKQGYDGRFEDLFFFIEERVQAACGPETGGRMNTARSRNDVDIALYRMVIRRELLDLLGLVLALRDTLIDLASRHTETVMPAHTHTQPAQPTTLAHYLSGVGELLGRDATRIRAAFATVNVSPLGACAITTTGFPIDREMTARLLGFDGITRNSYDSIAGADYILESMSALSTLMVGVGKFVQDLLLWSTREFGYVRIGDAYVQTSSIMPQKRNPVAFEHARVLASKAVGQSQAAALCIHNTPYGDIVDVEDDLQPLIASAFDDARRTLNLLSAAIQSAEFPREKLSALARDGYLTVTELADTLVRTEGLSFRAAHRIVQDSLREIGESYQDLPAAALRHAATALGRQPRIELSQLEAALDPDHFVRVRKIKGGPAPERVREQLALQAEEQLTLHRWRAGAFRGVTAYREVMRAEADRILS